MLDLSHSTAYSKAKLRLALRSSLRELEALAGLLVPVLLPLDHAGVAGEEAVVAEAAFEVGAHLLEGAGQAEDDRARLAVLAAAADIDEDVNPTRHLGAHQGGADVIALDLEREVGVAIQAVDLELARPFADADAGDRGLAPAGAPEIRLLSRRGHRVVSPLRECLSRKARRCLAPTAGSFAA